MPLRSDRVKCPAGPYIGRFSGGQPRAPDRRFGDDGNETASVLAVFFSGMERLWGNKGLTPPEEGQSAGDSVYGYP